MIKVYDINRNLKAILENASKIGYEKTMNALHKASFLMPSDDEKANECKAFRFVEVFADDEMDERIDLFRILPNKWSRKGSLITKSYDCEHVLGTLIDDIIPFYYQVDNIKPSDAINAVLSYQSEQRWVLGQCDFDDLLFSYKWEGDNLLSALFSITKTFLDEFWWTWDTSVYPWVLNLVKPSSVVSAEARVGKNIIDIERDEDPTGIVTRIWPKGYGEGVNQLTIQSVNPTGQKYIDADQSLIDEYGIISVEFVDRSIEDPQVLYNVGLAKLKESSQPYYSFPVKIADLYKITNSPADKFTEAALIRVFDEDLGIDINQRVVKISNQDIKGDPTNTSLEIANKKRDITDDTNDLRQRQRVAETNAQGATNIDTHDFADNCDPDHPAVIRFYVPEEAVHINKVLLNFELGKFRGYSQATKGGGALATTTASGGGSTQTSSSGGGSTLTSSSGGGTTTSSSAGGDHTHLMFKLSNVTGPVATTRFEAAAGGLVDLQASNQDLTTYGGSGNHTHSVTVPNHTHSVIIPNHTHSVNIPNHTHSLSLPDHTHEIQYGIYEGPQANSVTVNVDGNIVSGLTSGGSDVDLVDYLSKDSNGKINRGTWHEITITPNDLARINANILVQFFIQSRGGETL